MSKIEMAQWVIQHHFGIYADGKSKCAGCDESPWPCIPARLASDILAEELAS